MKIAYDAHHGQKDAGGIPYIFHPIHLAEQMDSEITVCAALLHDVVEDTDITLEELKQEFPKEIIDVVVLLTHQPKEDYFDYVRRIRKDCAARLVKLADLEHNSDESRLSEAVDITEKRKELWRVKYEKAHAILMESDPKVYEKLNVIRRELLSQSQEIMKEHRFEIFGAIQQMIYILGRAQIEGLYAVEQEAKQLTNSTSCTEQFLGRSLQRITKMNIFLIEGMLEEYCSVQREYSEGLIMYIYIRGVMMMIKGENSRTCEAIFLSMLPIEEREIFQRYPNRKSKFSDLR